MRLKRRNNLVQWLVQPFISQSRVEHQPDLVLLSMVGLLLFLGLFFLSSASATLAFYNYADSYKFVKQQILHGVLPGLVLFYITCRVNYNIYKKFTPWFLILSVILLALVFVTNFGGEFGTARSWLIIGSFSFQPSELVKLFLILFLAAWFAKKNRSIKDWKSSTIPFIIILGLISFLIIKQPDIGTLSIIVLTALVMFYAAGAKISHLLYIIGAMAIGFWAMIKAAPYRMNRFITWFNSDVDPQGIGWQIKQSLIAIGSGGWLGVGLGASKQKSYLPQPANDSIFAIVAEEIGFVFTLGFLILFIILMYRGFLIIKHSSDKYAQLIALGIIVWLSAQFFINIAGMIKLLPLTGVPLPFVSLGGTNLVVTLLSMGILANISKFTTYR